MSWPSLQSYYDASAGKEAKIRDSGSREILSLQGYMIDRVKDAGPRHTTLGEGILRCREIKEQVSSQKNDVSRGGESYVEAFWRVSMANVLPGWTDGRYEY
jgi:hypothetical protein